MTELVGRLIGQITQPVARRGNDITTRAQAAAHRLAQYQFRLRGYGWFDDGHYAYAVVVEAVNAVGSSPWVIAGSASKCEGCVM